MALTSTYSENLTYNKCPKTLLNKKLFFSLLISKSCVHTATSNKYYNINAAVSLQRVEFATSCFFCFNTVLYR